MLCEFLAHLGCCVPHRITDAEVFPLNHLPKHSLQCYSTVCIAANLAKFKLTLLFSSFGSLLKHQCVIVLHRVPSGATDASGLTVPSASLCLAPPDPPPLPLPLPFALPLPLPLPFPLPRMNEWRLKFAV